MSRYSYRNKRRGKRRKWKKNSYKSCPEKAMAFLAKHATSIYQGSKMALNVLNAEKKIYDFSVSLSPTSSAGAILHLDQIAQGDDTSDRSGRTLLMKGCYMRLGLNLHASATQSRIRLIVFTQHNNSAPAVLGLLNSIDINAFYSSDYHTLATIHYDKTFVLNTDYPEKAIKAYVTKSIKISYSGTASTALAMNNLYLLAISDEATNTPTVSGIGRLRYYDN